MSKYIQFAISGSIIMSMTSFGLRLGENRSYYKIDYKFQDIFSGSIISQFSHMTSLTLSNLLCGIPVMIINFFLVHYFGAQYIIDILIII